MTNEKLDLAKLSAEQKYKLVEANYAGIAHSYNQTFDNVDLVYRNDLDRFFNSLIQSGEIVAVGGGMELRYLAQRWPDVSDLDVSEEMLREAQKIDPKIKPVLGSIVDPPIPERSASGVLAFNSLIHIPPVDLPKALRGVHKILKPGGSFSMIFSIPETNTRGYVEQLMPDPDFEGEDLWYYRTLYAYDFMRQMISINGFVIKQGGIKFFMKYGERQGVIHANRRLIED